MKKKQKDELAKKTEDKAKKQQIMVNHWQQGNQDRNS